MSPVLGVEQLEKTYPRSWLRPPVTALKGVSLDVDQGEVFGFIGPNGAGKSTLIKILTGAMSPSAGRIVINGKDSSHYSARHGLGYVPESPYLNDYLTPLEVLQVGVRIHGLKLENEVGYCMGWLEKFGLADVCNRHIRSFSKGMTQRAVLAHALALKPTFLVLDEPLSGLDPLGRRDVIDILLDYKKEGGTLFFTSHVLYDVERIADRYGLIHQGELRAVRSPAALIGEDDHVVVRSFGGQSIDGQQAESIDRWTITISSGQLWQVLDQLRTAGQTLIEVRPALSLEAVFMKAVGVDANVNSLDSGAGHGQVPSEA